MFWVIWYFFALYIQLGYVEQWEVYLPVSTSHKLHYFRTKMALFPHLKRTSDRLSFNTELLRIERSISKRNLMQKKNYWFPFFVMATELWNEKKLSLSSFPKWVKYLFHYSKATNRYSVCRHFSFHYGDKFRNSVINF